MELSSIFTKSFNTFFAIGSETLCYIVNYQMRAIFCVILSFSLSLLYGQSKIVGFYADYFGHKLNIKPDSTFEYRYRFHLYSTWTKGAWSVTNDTIYFKWIPVYDTSRIAGKDGAYKDSLLLSLDTKPERLQYLETGVLHGFGQNYYPYPEKLFYRKNKLYQVKENGRLVKKKIRGFGIQKKYPPWYKREKLTQIH